MNRENGVDRGSAVRFPELPREHRRQGRQAARTFESNRITNVAVERLAVSSRLGFQLNRQSPNLITTRLSFPL